MTTREMHYDIKFKLNKIDSQQNKNLKIPEIDWVINEANEILIKLIAQPRVKNQFGFETSQRTIDDIRTIVRNNVVITPTKIDDKTYNGINVSCYPYFRFFHFATPISFF